MTKVKVRDQDVWTILQRVGLITALSASMIFAGGRIASAEEAGNAAFEMSTDYPGITAKAGDNISFSLDFYGVSGDTCDAALSVTDMPEGWEGIFKGSSSSQISRVHINTADGAVAQDLASFSLDIPEDAQDGVYTVELQALVGRSPQWMAGILCAVRREQPGGQHQCGSRLQPGSDSDDYTSGWTQRRRIYHSMYGDFRR